MKKVLTLVLAVALGTAASAQTEKGTWLVGGASDLGFTTGKTDNDQDDSETNFGLDVRAGMFVADNIAAGLNIGFESESFGDVSTTMLGVGPWLRYYLESMVFGQLGYDFTTASFDGDALGTGGDIGIGVGYAIFLGDAVAIEPMGMFHLTSFKPEGADESVSGSNFGLDVGISVYLN